MAFVSYSFIHSFILSVSEIGCVLAPVDMLLKGLMNYT